MIEQASFNQFKSLRQVSVSLGRFVVIVGPNGSGKTSILDGLLYLSQVTKRPLASVMSGVFEPANLVTRGATSPMTLEMSGHFAGTEAQVHIGPRDQDEKQGIVVRRRWGNIERLADDKGEKIGAPTKSKVPEPRPVNPSRQYGHENEAMKGLSSAVGFARKLRLDIDRLAAASYSDEETPAMQINGEGLASVLADLAGRSPQTFQGIQEAARAVVPTLERIRTQRARVIKHETQEIRIDDKPILHEIERPI